MLLLPYPVIDRVAVSLGPIQIKWYGISYLLGILLGYKYVTTCILKCPPNLFKNDQQFFDLAIGALISMVVGGRLGHVLLYGTSGILDVLYIWEGGMSFHGAFIGSCIYGIYKSKQLKIPFLYLADVFAAGTPVGLFLGRIANFINNELVGRPTDVSWAMIFPGDTIARHPSQLYEAFTEGLLLLLILNLFHRSKKIREKQGVLFCIFITFYGLFRSVCELFREPDFTFGLLTSGQIYSLPMILTGLVLGGILWTRKTHSSKS
jgi:phosphatidylglycerol:prolipoprotein diacylglycerol transferase